MLWQRVMTALVLAPLFLLGLFWLPPVGFVLFIGVFLLLASWEWGGLCGFTVRGRVLWACVPVSLAVIIWLLDQSFPARFLATLAGGGVWLGAAVAIFMYPRGHSIWAHAPVRALVGVAVMIPAWAALTLLQARSGGAWFVFWTLVLVWAVDTGAYFAGRLFGRHKLMPRVSSGKTLEGAAGGTALALVVAALLAIVGDLGAVEAAWMFGVALLVIAATIIGDLLESLIKRVAGVKDSGSLLPGHGGLLDRVDGVLAAMPMAVLLFTVLDVRPDGWLGVMFS